MKERPDPDAENDGEEVADDEAGNFGRLFFEIMDMKY